MSVGRTLVAVSLEQERLLAVCASVSGDRVKVKSWLSSPMAQDVDPKDASAVGRWVAEALKGAGMPRGPLVFAVPRGEVVLKKLKLPKGEIGEVELSGMVRLQMARQLTMAIDGTAIDYVPMTTEARAGEGAEATSETATATVLAGALPGDRMAWYREAARAAGAKIARVGLKAAGVSALLADVSQRHGGPVLGIAAGWGAIEFVVVEDGHLVFARSADIGMATPEDGGAFVSRVAVEAKRTWMSYRVGQESAVVDGIAVLGDGELSKQIGQAAGEALEMPWELVAAPPAVELPEDMPEAERVVAAPLIGLLAERVVARPTLDFANPRKAPDLAAAKRQRMLVAALLAIVVGGGLLVFAQGRLADLRRRVAMAEEQKKEVAGEYMRHLMEEAKLRHLETWREAKVDWLAHAAWLSERLPPPKDGLLNELAGSMRAGVEFVPDGKGWGTWKAQQAAAFTLEGSVKGRPVANELRGRLMESGMYKVESKGPDVPTSYSYELVTAVKAPAKERDGEAIGNEEQPADEGVSR